MIESNAQWVEDAAVDLLAVVWGGIDADFKNAYKREIWRIFEDRIKVAAQQNSDLLRFYTQLCQGLKVQPHDPDVAVLKTVLDRNGEHRAAILHKIRTEAAYLVLQVRLLNQQRQEEYKARMSEKGEGN